jgi:hypothetical protein
MVLVKTKIKQYLNHLVFLIIFLYVQDNKINQYYWRQMEFLTQNQALKSLFKIKVLCIKNNRSSWTLTCKINFKKIKKPVAIYAKFNSQKYAGDNNLFYICYKTNRKLHFVWINHNNKICNQIIKSLILFWIAQLIKAWTNLVTSYQIIKWMSKNY